MKAIIIGAGIGGMATALFLKKAGIETEVFESGPEKAAVAGGLGLAPNGMHVLSALGLTNQIIQAGTVIRYNWFKNAVGSNLAKIKFTDPERHDQPGVSIARHELVQILRAEAARQGLIIHYQKKLKSAGNSGNFFALFEDGSTVHGDLLIGADGINSVVRNCLFPEGPHPNFTGIISSGGFADKVHLRQLSNDSFSSLNFIYGRNGFFGFGGSGHEKIMWWTNIPAKQPYTKHELLTFDWDLEKSMLLNHYGNYSYPVPSIIKSSENLIRVNIFDIQSLPRWSSRQIILIGDAAHAVSPSSGQGASMALEDGMLLARLLRDEQNIGAAFLKFEELRKPRVEKIVEEGRRRGSDKAVTGFFGQWIREIMIMIFVNLFGVKGNDWLFDYKISWSKFVDQQ